MKPKFNEITWLEKIMLTDGRLLIANSEIEAAVF